MSTIINGEGDLFALADGTLITWERITGDATSMAIAFFHTEVDPDEPDADPVLWISPGGWQPVSPMQAGITYPAIALGTLAEILARSPEMAEEVAHQAAEARQTIDNMESRIRAMSARVEASRIIELPAQPEDTVLPTLMAGGTYPRDHALLCAVQWLAGRPDISAHAVTDAAAIFAEWLDSPMPRPDAL